jgi:hypothetical protein
MTTHEAYARYTDDVEVIQPDEAKLIEEVVASFARMGRMAFDKHRHAVRGAHAKSPGILKGILTVHDDLAPHLRQGLFRTPASYPVVVRFSSAPGDIHGDSVPLPKGMAIKVIGVEGRKVLPRHQGDSTQDFQLVNHPVIPFGKISTYALMQRFVELNANDSDGTLVAAGVLAKGAAWALNRVGVESHTLETAAMPHHHILGETFHSMGAVRFGEYIAKISAAPLSAEVRALTGRHYNPVHAPSIVRTQIREFFRDQGASYELRAQLCTNLEKMPIEDASVVWSEEDSPHQPIAKIVFQPQDTDGPARRVYADDVLSFNPWHCMPEHRPLGSIMRARKAAYESSAAFRHTMNAQPRLEPRSIDEIPD